MLFGISGIQMLLQYGIRPESEAKQWYGSSQKAMSTALNDSWFVETWGMGREL
jgi:hypothetical protein